MRTIPSITALALAAGLAAVPAFAQPGPASAPKPAAPATVATPAVPAAATADARASKVIGAAVYNDHNDKVGSVSDLVIGRDGKLSAVLSVGGFLGMGNKLVAVPYGDLKMGDAGGTGRVVIAGATKDSVKAMPDYHFAHS